MGGTRLVGWIASCDDAPEAVASDDHDHEHEHDHDQGLAGAGATAVPAGSVLGDFAWQLPDGFPLPAVPTDNPMSTAKVALGRRLFYDTRLSGNQTQSCASCHRQELAFTDGRATGLGSTGESHPRGPMALANLAYTPSLTWANPLLSVEAESDAMQRQVETPLYGTVPVELGMEAQTELEERLRAVPEYRSWFVEAFAGEPEPLTGLNITRAIAAFERTLISSSAPYDRFERGDTSALSESAQRGYELFFGEKLECFHCHSAPFFTDHFHYQGKALIELKYHNTGLYNVDGQGAYPAGNMGVHEVTGRAADMGMFKAPTLRNIAKTAPYMHDGSIATLSEVLEHYAAGGRTLSEGPNAGVGSRNPFKDRLIRGFSLSDQERDDVIAFLESLTDEDFLADPAFSNPWP